MVIIWKDFDCLKGRIDIVTVEPQRDKFAQSEILKINGPTRVRILPYICRAAGGSIRIGMALSYIHIDTSTDIGSAVQRPIYVHAICRECLSPSLEHEHVLHSDLWFLHHLPATSLFITSRKRTSRSGPQTARRPFNLRGKAPVIAICSEFLEKAKRIELLFTRCQPEARKS
jgi:hypothetical protein